MKKEKLNVAIIVIMVIVTIALIGLIVYDAIKEYTLQKGITPLIMNLQSSVADRVLTVERVIVKRPISNLMSGRLTIFLFRR